MAESFFSSLKEDKIGKHTYHDRDSETKDIADYIDSFYNPIRWHGQFRQSQSEDL